MARTDARLERKVDELVTSGGDPLRIEVLRCAQRFKRSWIEMAVALSRVRDTRAYEAWGYRDLHQYCAEELLIKPATADKLTVSLSTIRRHAPRLVDEPTKAGPVPSMDAVDYFARAAGEHPRARPAAGAEPEVIEQLRQAVFEQARPLSALRRDFGPALYPKPPEQQLLERLRRARSTAQRLVALLEEIEGLSASRVTELRRILAALERDLEALMPPRQGPGRGARAQAG